MATRDKLCANYFLDPKIVYQESYKLESSGN